MHMSTMGRSEGRIGIPHFQSLDTSPVQQVQQKDQKNLEFCSMRSIMICHNELVEFTIRRNQSVSNPMDLTPALTLKGNNPVITFFDMMSSKVHFSAQSDSPHIFSIDISAPSLML